MKLRVGYTINGSIDIAISTPPDIADDELCALVEEHLAALSDKELINYLEGMPDGIEGDAIQIVCLEELIPGEEPFLIYER